MAIMIFEFECEFLNTNTFLNSLFKIFTADMYEQHLEKETL